MPTDQQPDMAKLEREGVPLRKCIAYGEAGYSGKVDGPKGYSVGGETKSAVTVTMKPKTGGNY